MSFSNQEAFSLNPYADQSKSIRYVFIEENGVVSHKEEDYFSTREKDDRFKGLNEIDAYLLFSEKEIKDDFGLIFKNYYSKFNEQNLAYYRCSCNSQEELELEKIKAKILFNRMRENIPKIKKIQKETGFSIEEIGNIERYNWEHSFSLTQEIYDKVKDIPKRDWKIYSSNKILIARIEVQFIFKKVILNILTSNNEIEVVVY